jgi:hypothetical protein
VDGFARFLTRHSEVFAIEQPEFHFGAMLRAGARREACMFQETGVRMDSKDAPIKDELVELSGAVSEAADSGSLHRALDSLTEYLSRKNEQRDRALDNSSLS